MSSRMGSLEEKVKLPPTETISRCYQQQGNRKVIRILTVAVYVLCVSLAAIMLSLYYIFIWDPSIRPFVTKANNCEKIVIPEKIAIRLLNSSEITAEQFYKRILDQYRILNILQQQRQAFLQKQHLQLQQLAAGNKFQEIFATATIIQANPNDPIKKPITPTNGTFLLEQRPPMVVGDMADPLLTSLSNGATVTNARGYTNAAAATPATHLASSSSSRFLTDDPSLVAVQRVPILDTIGPAHSRRKQHRKHYGHHRHNSRKNHKKPLSPLEAASPKIIGQTPLNPPPPIAVVHEPYTAIPIPLILNSKEDKQPYYPLGERKSVRPGAAGAAEGSSYDARNYLHPFLNGELIFEK